MVKRSFFSKLEKFTMMVIEVVGRVLFWGGGYASGVWLPRTKLCQLPLRKFVQQNWVSLTVDDHKAADRILINPPPMSSQ